MKSKFRIGDVVDFEGLTGEIVGIQEYDLEDYDWPPSYEIKVKSSAMKGGFCIMKRAEEQIEKAERRAEQYG